MQQVRISYLGQCLGDSFFFCFKWKMKVNSVEILSAFSHANFSFTQNFTAWNRMWVHGNLDLLPLWVTVSAMVSASCSRSYGYARLSWVAWWVERGTSASSGIWIS